MRRRILATIVIVTTVAVTLVFIPAALAIRSRIQRGDVLELQREAAIVANEVTPSGPIDVDELAQRINSDHDLALYDELGRRVAGEGPEIGDRPVVLASSSSSAIPVGVDVPSNRPSPMAPATRCSSSIGRLRRRASSQPTSAAAAMIASATAARRASALTMRS